MEETKKSKLEKKEGAFKKIWAFIKEDHKFENWVLFFLALILLVISIYTLVAAASDNNTFADTYFDLSNSGWGIFNKPWKIIVCSSVVIAISVASILYCLIPVFKPSFKELKLVTWTDKKTLFKNSVIVIVFIALLSALFLLFEAILVPIFDKIF